MAEDINWIIEFERLARPRLQKIFEKDLLGIPVALGERLEQLRKKEASNRADAEAELQLNSRLASAISGWRCFGSSCGSGS